MKNDNGQQLSLTQAQDLLKSRQGKNFKTEDVNLAELERWLFSPVPNKPNNDKLLDLKKLTVFQI